ncbi:MAG TPA: HAMP domain-containing sensor histidine kinase [Symbiobacteriaceae bacterium]|nr:HAMP domain-containing sensor histidine kinase [Symbiobacteriaceae bacterium]
MSIRLRLTLLYTGLTAVALVLFSFLLYGVLRWTFIQTVDEHLKEVAGEVARYFQTNSALPPLDTPFDQTTFIMVRSAGDQFMVTSGNFRGSFQLPEQARSGQDVFVHDVDARGASYRLYTLPILHADGRPLFYVQVAHSLQLLDLVSDRLRLPLYAGTILMLGLAAMGAWWVALRAIEPIDKVARAAVAIGESADLSMRVPHHGPDDEVGQLVDTFNDMLEQLQGLYCRLAASVDAQQRFVADASHELRTPLTIIRGNIDYLQRARALDPEALADMASEAERMSRMVEELLTMARADAGQTPDLQPLILGPLVTEACRKAQALPHQAEFRLELPEVLNRITVDGHSEWLTRIILILIDNAFKYTAQGTVTVRVGRQNDGVVIQVQDTGIGIAREDLPHVFERFYRADRARARGGTGLGLAIARWAAGIHGGKLSVESDLGKGSTFSLWLPIKKVHD